MLLILCVCLYAQLHGWLVESILIYDCGQVDMESNDRIDTTEGFFPVKYESEKSTKKPNTLINTNLLNEDASREIQHHSDDQTPIDHQKYIPTKTVNTWVTAFSEASQ